MTNHRPLSSAEGDEYRFALKPERTTAAVPLGTKDILICSACGLLYDGDNEGACAAADSPEQAEADAALDRIDAAPEPDCPNCMGEGGDCPMCEGSGKIGGALDVGQRPLKDSEVVDPCPNCSAPVFLLDGDPVGLLHDYASQGPHDCPVSDYTDGEIILALRNILDHGVPHYSNPASEVGEYLFDKGYVARDLDGAARDGTAPWWLLQMGEHHLVNLQSRATPDLDAARRESAASPGGQPRSGRKSLTDLCDFIAENHEVETTADVPPLFGRPNGMDYTLDCTDEASASECHVQGLRLWLLLDAEERTQFLKDWGTARKAAIIDRDNERLNTLRCALHETTILGFTAHHEYPGHTEISAPWMQPTEGDSLGIVADPDAILSSGEVVYSLITGHDSIPGPTVLLAWTDDVEENARLWRAATVLAIGAVLRGVAVLMDGGDANAAEKAMDTPVIRLDAEGIEIRD
jgi:hypothetical protein